MIITKVKRLMRAVSALLVSIQQTLSPLPAIFNGTINGTINGIAMALLMAVLASCSGSSSPPPSPPNINDIAPVMTSKDTVSVPENSLKVLMLEASDADNIPDQVQFFTLGGMDASLFRVADNAELRFKTPPSYEEPECVTGNVCRISVTPSDGLNTGDPQSITITVLNDNNEFPPVIANNPPILSVAARVNVPENRASVVTLTVSDEDSYQQTVTYRISGGDSQLFTISDTLLSFKTAPDFEMPVCPNNLCQLNITPAEVTATGAEGAGIAQTIAIKITNVNDEAPRMLSTDQFIAFEGSRRLFQLLVEDADNLAGQTHSFMLTGTDSEHFIVDGSYLNFKITPDFENPVCNADNNCVVVVTPSDGINRGAAQNIVVIVVDSADEIAPVIDNNRSIEVAENNNHVAILMSTDPDSDSPERSTIYSIDGVDAELFFLNNRFTGYDIDSTLNFIEAPDFEDPKCGVSKDSNRCQITITASDRINTAAPTTFTITVVDADDIAPIISITDTVTVPENTSGAILTLSATDQDTPSQSISYSISGTDAGLFEISVDQSSGNSQLSFSNAPNFESPACAAGNSCVIAITPSDGTNSGVAQTVRISVTDVSEAPIMTSADSVDVDENTTTVLTLTAIDQDVPSQAISYSLSGTDAGLFAISGSQLSFNSAPDFENPPCVAGASCVVVVTPSDGTNDGVAQTITIVITNINDQVPTISSTNTVTIAEDTLAVLTLAATADSAAQSLTYAITGADAGLFTISGGVLSFIVAPDFENPTCVGGTSCVVVLTLSADSLTGTPQTITITVTNVNEVPVMTSASSVNVAENSSGVILTLTASDQDSATTSITYAITGGADSQLFTISGDELSLDQPLDFEMPICNQGNSCVVAVTPTDDGNSSGDEQSISVAIEDIASLRFADSSAAEGDSGTFTFQSIVSLSSLANASVDFSISAGSALADSDYTATLTTGTLDFTGATSAAIAIDFIGDTTIEGYETLSITLSNPTGTIEAPDTALIVVTIINDDLIILNDTGIEFAGDYPSGNFTGCSGSAQAFRDALASEQDCAEGRDAQLRQGGGLPKVGSGAASFDFTKLGADGSALAIQTATYSVSGTEAAGTIWSCVRDNHTGLVWQVHTDYATADIYDKDNTYRWGGTGAIGRGTTNAYTYYDDWNYLVTIANDATGSTVGANALCGLTDWRVAQHRSLNTILHYGASNPAIDSDFFPNTIAGEYHVSSRGYSTPIAWYVNFNHAGDQLLRTTGSPYSVRLVSGEQMQIVDWRDSRYHIEIRNGDYTVIDTYTNLMWQRCTIGQDQTSPTCAGSPTFDNSWLDALQVASDSTVAGYSDWRLPNIKELATLVVLDINTVFNIVVFPNSSQSTSSYWSATPNSSDTNKSFTIGGFTNSNEVIQRNNVAGIQTILVRDLPDPR